MLNVRSHFLSTVTLDLENLIPWVGNTGKPVKGLLSFSANFLVRTCLNEQYKNPAIFDFGIARDNTIST